MKYKAIDNRVYQIMPSGGLDPVPGEEYETSEQAVERAAEMNLTDNEDDGVLLPDDDEIEVPADVAMMFAEALPEPSFEYEIATVSVDEAGDEHSHIQVQETAPAPEDWVGVVGDTGAPRRYVRRVLFRDLVVATEEVNDNNDEITGDNLKEFVASAAHMPINDVHPKRRRGVTTIGVMTGGRVYEIKGQEDAASRGHAAIDGYFWAGRNPVIVRETIAGKRRPSIEAYSEQEGCSVCGQWFASSDNYCAHLAPIAEGRRLPDNVTRRHKGLTAAGIAVVYNPAGSGVGFNNPHFYLAADRLPNEEDEMGNGNTPGTETPTAPATVELEARNAELLASANEHAANLEAARADLETTKADLATAQASVASVTAAMTKLRERVGLMADARMSAQQIADMAKMETTVSASDEDFAFLCASMGAPEKKQKNQPDTFADTGDDTQPKGQLTAEGFAVEIV